jgi:DNA primase
LIPQKTVDQILSTAKIEEVVEDFLNLKRRGVNMLGLCPFHDEKTPSFTVSPTKNIYKCFGCGKAGNPVSFIMEHEGSSYPEALKYLANKYNIEIEEKQFSPEDLKEKQLVDSYFLVNEFAKDHFVENLFNTDEGKNIGLSYLKSRGFRESTIRKFQLGFTVLDSKDLTKKAKEKLYNIELLKALGLTTKSDYDFFRERVMFTIHNVSGKAIGFGGRTLKSEKTIPKYINSIESEIYNKRKTLYGLYFAKTSIRKEDNCILVEGYTDVISLSQGGVENVVASSGTSLTREQILLIKRYTPNITIIYDGDQAGIKAALRGMDLILEQDMNVKLVLLPEGEDPDSFMKSKGHEGFSTYLTENAKDFILFKTDLILQEAGNDPIKKANLLKDIVESIAKIPDMIKRSIYIQECSLILGVEEQVLISTTNSIIKKEINSRYQEQERSKFNEIIKSEGNLPDDTSNNLVLPSQAQPTLFNDEPQERDIVRIIVTLGDKIYDEDTNITVAQYIINNLEGVLESFENPLYQKMINIVIELLNQNKKVSPEIFLNSKDNNIQKTAIDFLAVPTSNADWESKGIYLQTQKIPEENFIKDSFQAILRFKLKKVVKYIAEIENTIKSSDPDSPEIEKYIKVLQHLMEERNQVAANLNTVVLKFR